MAYKLMKRIWKSKAIKGLIFAGTFIAAPLLPIACGYDSCKEYDKYNLSRLEERIETTCDTDEMLNDTYYQCREEVLDAYNDERTDHIWRSGIIPGGIAGTTLCLLVGVGSRYSRKKKE